MLFARLRLGKVASAGQQWHSLIRCQFHFKHFKKIRSKAAKLELPFRYGACRMRKYSKIIWVPVVAAITLLVSGSAAGKIAVFVSIIPQKYFVQQIGKNLVDIQVMVQPGASPASYEPKPRQMAAIAKTHIYFSIGVPFENVWLKKIASSNPDMMVVQTDHGIQKIPMADHHFHREEADHQETDQHHEKRAWTRWKLDGIPAS